MPVTYYCPLGKEVLRRKRFRRTGSHKSIFLNSQDPPEYSPPSVHLYKQMSKRESQETNITPPYIENTILVGNQMSFCLRAVWDMLAV